MTRQYCDRCKTDVTGKISASVRIVSDADTLGNGEVTTAADLCQACRKLLEAWLTTAPDAAPARGRARGAERTTTV
jgi:hypothetical protein